MEEVKTHTPAALESNRKEEIEPVLEQAEETPAGSGVTVSQYRKVIWDALQAKRVSSKCQECRRAQGWKDWSLLDAPLAIDYVGAGGRVPVIGLICKQCATVRFYSTAVLGVTFTTQEEGNL